MSEYGPINFLPDDYCSRKVRRPAALLAGVLLLTIGVGMTAALIASRAFLNDSRNRFADASHQYQSALAHDRNILALDGEQQELLQHAHRAADLLPAAPRSRLLAELTNALPTGVFITQIAMESHPLPANGTASAFDQKKQSLQDARRPISDSLPTVPPTQCVVTVWGVAESPEHVANYCRNLAASASLENVKLVADEICSAGGNDSANRRQFEARIVVSSEGRPANTPAQQIAPVAVAE